MTRFTSTGNTRPHIVHNGYQHTSRQSSRWERPAGEPSLLEGALIVCGFGLLGAVVWAMLP